MTLSMIGGGREGPAVLYERVERAGRIEGASSHALVQLLFDELSVALIRVRRAIEAGGEPQAMVRALDIIESLRRSLDHDRGGALAASLSGVYDQVIYHLLAGVRDRKPDRIGVAWSMVEEVGDAWRQIAG